MVLLHITRGIPLYVIGKKFGLAIGTVQKSQEEATRFCAMVVAFCEHLNWNELAVYIAGSKDSIEAGCSDARCKALIMGMQGVTPTLASRLVKHEYLSAEDIHSVTEEELLEDLLSDGVFMPKSDAESVRERERMAKQVRMLKSDAERAVKAAGERGVFF